MMMFFLVMSILTVVTMQYSNQLQLAVLPVFVEQKSTNFKRGMHNGY